MAEGANMPSTLPATASSLSREFSTARPRPPTAAVLPTSGLEMAQNSQRMAWSREEVDQKLHNIMVEVHRNCFETAAKYGAPGNLVAGANIGGFLKVANAMMDQGLV